MARDYGTCVHLSYMNCHAAPGHNHTPCVSTITGIINVETGLLEKVTYQTNITLEVPVFSYVFNYNNMLQYLE